MLNRLRCALFAAALFALTCSAVQPAGIVSVGGPGCATACASGGGGGGGSTFSHGDAFTITGTSMGSNSLDYAFMGGSGGIIESTAAGAEVANSFSGWNTDGGTGGGSRGEKRGYDDAVRGRVFTSDYSATFPDTSTITRDTGTSIPLSDIVYVSYWLYLTGLDNFNSGQVKLIRLTAIDDITDPNTQLYLSSANQASGLMLLPNPNGGGTAVAASNPLGQNNWYRVEMVTEVQSTQNVATTKTTVRIWNGSVHPSAISFTHSGGFDHTNMNIYPNATRSRYIIWQGYMGNGITTGTMRTDDHYEQRGTWNRVELCDASTYLASVDCEEQPLDSYSSTSITGHINRGGLTNGTRYLYVLDSTNTPLGSKTITLQ